MSDSVNILIADSDAIVTELLGDYLERHGIHGKPADDILSPEGILSSGSGVQAVLVDPNLPGIVSPNDLERLIKLAEPRPVILFSGPIRREILHHALDMGVRGLIPKSSSLRTLTNAIRFVLSGEIFVPADMWSSASDRVREGSLSLSQKEVEVLRQLRLGRMNKEIALDLGLSVVSVKMLVRTLCNKLSAKNRTQAALLASKMLLD